MRLDRFDNTDFERGRSRFVEGLWRLCEGLFLNSWLPGSKWRVLLLRAFGGKLGRGVVIKPHVRVKFPWKLSVGDHSWIGEGVWIDNLDQVSIGSHCCVSQGSYLCTGNHRWDRPEFDLETGPIVIEDQCWIGAMSRVGPGVTCRQGAVLSMGGMAVSDLDAWTIHGGVPARALRERRKSG